VPRLKPLVNTKKSDRAEKITDKAIKNLKYLTKLI
jgi:hypothetical protein